MSKNEFELSHSARKALTVQLGESAGNEIVQLIQRMGAQIEELRRSKVSVTHVIPDVKKTDPLLASLESETF